MVRAPPAPARPTPLFRDGSNGRYVTCSTSVSLPRHHQLKAPQHIDACAEIVDAVGAIVEAGAIPNMTASK
jgi:hypothetical protein